MAHSERLPTRLNPVAERTCFSQVALRAKEESLHARMLSFERALQARESAAGGKLRTMLCQRPHIEVVLSSDQPDTGSARPVRSRARRLQPARVVKCLPGLPS